MDGVPGADGTMPAGPAGRMSRAAGSVPGFLNAGRPAGGAGACCGRLVAMTAGDHRAAGRLLLVTTALTSAFRSGCDT